MILVAGAALLIAAQSVSATTLVSHIEPWVEPATRAPRPETSVTLVGEAPQSGNRWNNLYRFKEHPHVQARSQAQP